MKDSTKHRIKGKVLEMKGAVKEKAGDIANDIDLAVDGEVDQAAGKAEQAFGKVQSKLEK